MIPALLDTDEYAVVGKAGLRYLHRSPGTVAAMVTIRSRAQTCSPGMRVSASAPSQKHDVGAVLFGSVFGFAVTRELALRILEPSFVSSAPESIDLLVERPAVASSLAMSRLALRPAGLLWVDVLARNLSRRYFEQLSLIIFKCVTVM
jgi:hypothetical protein